MSRIPCKLHFAFQWTLHDEKPGRLSQDEKRWCWHLGMTLAPCALHRSNDSSRFSRRRVHETRHGSEPLPPRFAEPTILSGTRGCVQGVWALATCLSSSFDQSRHSESFLQTAKKGQKDPVFNKSTLIYPTPRKSSLECHGTALRNE